MAMHYFSISEAKQVALEMAESEIAKGTSVSEQLFLDISNDVGACDKDSQAILQHLHNALD
ncbi:MAG: hypothetical protein CL760_05500 [Chloroflexi bacterium]|nr:hypothetical protein [Chloroflexota bacterium]|tara:strand:- start:55248 stop:55430 length:183 start_codon:yes stop_codon:yes gene_type:complete